MVRARARLSKSGRELKPLLQGDLDGLCGLYSTLNALRLAHHPRKLRRADLIRLTKAGLKVLSGTRRLNVIIYDGMYPEIWERMAEEVLSCFMEHHRQQYRLVAMIGRSDRATHKLAQNIRRMLHEGHPVVLLLAGRLDHWTVAAAYSRHRLGLFDSAGHRWISWAKLALSQEDGRTPHRVERAYALVPSA